jgi:uncharacterized protein YecE (DUF72 family)
MGAADSLDFKFVPVFRAPGMTNKEIARIGTAGWAVPSVATDTPGKQGSQLQRYSAYFSCAEINTSFYRPHRAETYARWAASVPRGFRFTVKAPRAITHEAKLRDSCPPLKMFFEQLRGFGPALGSILVQLPPSLKFDPTRAEIFLNDFRKLFAGEAVLEPRHLTWFNSNADELLWRYHVGRVAADPAPSPIGAIPGGWAGLRYWRLHRSPQMCFTPYGEYRLRPLVDLLSPNDWCIFDNTASGAAMTDALLLQRLAQL